MAFVITLGFATEQDRDAFNERILPKVYGKAADPVVPEGEPDGLHRTAVAVTSQTAARDVCHQTVAFLAHSKNDQVILTWTGADGNAHSGDVTGKSARDAEFLAVRVGAAAKAHLDKEKS
jgi:hypothetical protein